jgi:antitoxin component YwqK of YwqJK toxin-antitoxin module
MKKVILFVGIFLMSFIGYSENFKGTDKEFMEMFNPNFDTFTKRDGSIYTGRIEVTRSATGKQWFVMDVKDGKKNGKVVFYFKDGKKKSESNYDRGRITGKYVFYDGNGKVLYETNLKNGTGMTKDYTEDGKLALTIEYVNGVKEGKVTTYNTDGTVKEVAYYFDGREEAAPAANPVAVKTKDEKKAVLLEIKTKMIDINKELHAEYYNLFAPVSSKI